MTDTTVNPKAVLLLERGVKALQKKNLKTALLLAIIAISFFILIIWQTAVSG